DAAYIRLQESKIVDSETITSGIIYDYDEHDQVVGIEILSIKQRTPDEIKNLNIPLKDEDKQQLKALFNLFSCVVA
ncbi:MAG: DUF2283 domain-containing protein, partial [Microcystaceae cyanobacterium]